MDLGSSTGSKISYLKCIKNLGVFLLQFEFRTLNWLKLVIGEFVNRSGNLFSELSKGIIGFFFICSCILNHIP